LSRILSRQNVLTLYVPTLTLSLGMGIAVPALPGYAQSFGVSFGVAQAVLVAFSIGGLLGSIPSGYLTDRFGRRHMTVAGPVLVALSSFLAAVAQSFPELLVYRFLAGVGQQMWNIGRTTIVAETGADRERGRQMSTIMAMQNLGLILGPAVGGVVAAIWGVRIPFVFYGILAIVSTLPANLVRHSTGAEGDPPAAGRGDRGRTEPDAAEPDPGWAWAWRHPIFIFFVALFFAGMSRGALFSGTLNVYAVYEYGVGPDVVGFMAGAAGAISIPITLGAGAVMDRFGRKASIIPGFALIAAGLSLMVMTAAMGWPFPVFIVIFLMVQGALTITSGNLQVLGSDLAPASVRGRFFGVWQMVNQLGSVLSPSVFALLAETAGAPVGFAYLALASLMVVILIAFYVPDPIGRARAAAAPARR
jgi:MFS family permease